MRKRGMASNPLFIIPDFFCFFPMNFGMASWVLLENAKKNLVFYFGGGHHAFFPQKPVVKCLSQKLQKCIYSNLQPGCLVVRRLSTFTYWCIKMNRSSLNFSPSNQYIFLLFFAPFWQVNKTLEKKSLNIVMITVQKIPNHFFL